jgi:predicted membrane-bound mannosyltransferase
LIFTNCFSNNSGLRDVVMAWLPYFRRGGGASPHIYPWYWYFKRALWFHSGNGPVWSEALILILALVGAAAGFARRGIGEANATFWRFLSLYFLINAGIYSVIPYKTPWCMINFWLPAILMAGAGTSVLYREAKFQWARATVVCLSALGMSQLGAQAWAATGKYASTPANPFVYGQTLPDTARLIQEVKSLSQTSPEGKNILIKVIAPDDDYWPLPWELRRFKRTGWFNTLPADPSAKMIIVAASLNARLDDQHTHAMVGYFELRPHVFLELYVEAELWRAFVASRRDRPDEDSIRP